MGEVDTVHRRIVVEYGQQYVYLRLETSDGRIIGDSEEAWQQPYRLDKRDAAEEALEGYQWFYQWLQDTVLHTKGEELQGGDGGQPESD